MSERRNDAADQRTVEAALRDMPHDPQKCEAQLEGTRALLTGQPKRVLDLGCGDGRLLVPLAADGHTLLGIDADQHAISACRTQLDGTGASATCLHIDFLCEDWPQHEAIMPQTPPNNQGFDAVLLLGNTLLTIVDVDEALGLFLRIRRVLKKHGCLLLDDVPHDLWPELTEGNWTNGLSEDGAMQMIWHPAEPVFAIRSGDRVDSSSWTFRHDDRLLRLWTLDLLRLVTRQTGLSEPEHHPDAGLLVMHAVQGSR